MTAAGSDEYAPHSCDIHDCIRCDVSGTPADEYVPGHPVDLDGPAACAVLDVMEEWGIGIVWGVHIGTKVQLANEYARAALAGREATDGGS